MSGSVMGLTARKIGKEYRSTSSSARGAVGRLTCRGPGRSVISCRSRGMIAQRLQVRQDSEALRDRNHDQLRGATVIPARDSAESRPRRTSSIRSAPKTPRPEPPVVEAFFILGTILIVVGFLWSIAKSWPSIDPLALAALVGIGLLLVVVCERLGLILRELRKITTLMQRAVSDADPAEQRPRE